jgi:hypothetical protein
MRLLHRRPKLSRRTKEFVWDMTRGRCWYCGFPVNPFRNFHIDHVVPLSRGGSNEIDNLAPACQECNLYKASMLVDEWRETHYCRSNVLDSPWDGRFWFETEWSEDRWSTIIWPRENHKYWRTLEVEAFYRTMEYDEQGE